MKKPIKENYDSIEDYENALIEFGKNLPRASVAKKIHITFVCDESFANAVKEQAKEENKTVSGFVHDVVAYYISETMSNDDSITIGAGFEI